MRNVLTLIADPARVELDSGIVDTARSALERIGARVAGPDWLAPRTACDLPFAAIDPQAAEAALRQELSRVPIDVVAQRIPSRRKKLLVADMDATIIMGESLDELADIAGLKAQVAAITRRSMNGEIDFATALRQRVAMLKGLPAAALERTAERITLTPGARALVQTMRAAGAYTVLVSGGFRHFTRPVGAAVGFDRDEANELEIVAGRLTGRVKEPILGRDGKLRVLREVAAERRVARAQILAVGDGANDLPMLKAAGLGVAYRAKPAVAAAAKARIEHGDLTALLYIQGYRTEEIAE